MVSTPSRTYWAMTSHCCIGCGAGSSPARVLCRLHLDTPRALCCCLTFTYTAISRLCRRYLLQAVTHYGHCGFDIPCKLQLHALVLVLQVKHALLCREELAGTRPPEGWVPSGQQLFGSLLGASESRGEAVVRGQEAWWWWARTS